MLLPFPEHSGVSFLWYTVLRLLSPTGMEIGEGRHQQISTEEVIWSSGSIAAPVASARPVPGVVGSLEADACPLRVAELLCIHHGVALYHGGRGYPRHPAHCGRLGSGLGGVCCVGIWPGY